MDMSGMTGLTFLLFGSLLQLGALNGLVSTPKSPPASSELRDSEKIKEALKLLNLGKNALRLNTEDPETLMHLLENPEPKGIEKLLSNPDLQSPLSKKQHLKLTEENGHVFVQNFTNVTAGSIEEDSPGGIEDVFEMVMLKNIPGKKENTFKITIVEKNEVKPHREISGDKHLRRKRNCYWMQNFDLPRRRQKHRNELLLKLLHEQNSEEFDNEFDSFHRNKYLDELGSDSYRNRLLDVPYIRSTDPLGRRNRDYSPETLRDVNNNEYFRYESMKDNRHPLLKANTGFYMFNNLDENLDDPEFDNNRNSKTSLTGPVLEKGRIPSRTGIGNYLFDYTTNRKTNFGPIPLANDKSYTRNRFKNHNLFYLKHSGMKSDFASHSTGLTPHKREFKSSSFDYLGNRKSSNVLRDHLSPFELFMPYTHPGSHKNVSSATLIYSPPNPLTKTNQVNSIKKAPDSLVVETEIMETKSEKMDLNRTVAVNRYLSFKSKLVNLFSESQAGGRRTNSLGALTIASAWLLGLISICILYSHCRWNRHRGSAARLNAANVAVHLPGYPKQQQSVFYPQNYYSSPQVYYKTVATDDADLEWQSEMGDWLADDGKCQI